MYAGKDMYVMCITGMVSCICMTHLCVECLDVCIYILVYVCMYTVCKYTNIHIVVYMCIMYILCGHMYMCICIVPV